VCACEKPPPPPIAEDQCPVGALACGNDRECFPTAFCAREPGEERGCCVDYETECPRRTEFNCGPPICVDTLPVPNDAAFVPRATLCEEGVCIITDGEGGCFESAPAPASCVVVNGGVALSGRPIRMEALALDENGAPAAYPPATTWSFDGSELVATCDGPATCNVNVTAQMGPVSCTGSVRVYPVVGGSRAIVVDRGFVPLAGVRVDFVVAGTRLTRVTDGDGVARVNGEARAITAMPETHEWHSVIGSPRDVVIVTRPLERSRARTGTVDFTRLHTQGDIKIALTGFAIPSLADMTLADVFGEPVPTNVELEGITDPGGQVVTLPSSLVLFLGDNAIRDRWAAFGNSALAWSVGAQVPLAEVGPIISGVATGGSSAENLLPAMLPFLARADHFVGLRDEVVTPSMLSLVTRELAIGEHQTPHVLATAFVRVPGHGVVPLGLGALPSDSDVPLPPNVVAVDFAPPHDGLEGSDVFVTAAALDLDALSTTSTQMARAPLGDSVAIAMPAFVPLVDAVFDGSRFSTTTTDIGADLYRVRFDGWTVWSATPPSFTLADLLRDNVPPTRSGKVRVDAFVTNRPLDFATQQELDTLVTSMSSRTLH
jgi:hypothetical protein